MLSGRQLTIVIALAIVFLVGVATVVAHYATSGEHDDPAKTAPAP